MSININVNWIVSLCITNKINERTRELNLIGRDIA